MIRRLIFQACFVVTLTAVPAFSAPVQVPGTTEGGFSVSPDGAASFSIAIKAPPGTAGMEPKIALSYNSRGGASALGFGWAIGGLSSVQRGPRNLGEDGIVRGVSLDVDDALYLDGDKLVQVGADPSEGFREFRTRIEKYSRIRAYEWDAAGPKRIVVETRAGLKLMFGSGVVSRVMMQSSGKILSWLCDRIEDSVGNYMTYSYIFEGLDHKIKEISYTGNIAAGLQPYAKVVFEYEKVEPYELRYILGEQVQPNSVLRSIVTSFEGKVHRRYSLKHEPIDKFRKALRLVEVEESGSDGLSFKPLRFKYSEAKGNWEELKIAAFPVPQEIVEWKDVLGGMSFINVEGDGKPELLYGYSANNVAKRGAYKFDPSTPGKKAGWRPLGNEFRAPLDLGRLGPAEPDEVRTNLAVHDINGDGFSDILVSSGIENGRVYVGGDKGWSTPIAAAMDFKFEVSGRRDNRHLFIDVDPDKKDGEEFIWASAEQHEKFGAVKFNGTSWTPLSSFKPPYLFERDSSGLLNGVYAIDVDCNGTKELVYNLARADGARVREVRRSTTKWEEHDKQDDKFLLPFDPVPHSGAIRFEDLNADGCKDVVVAYRSKGRIVREAFLADRLKGWQPDPRPLPKFEFWSGEEGSPGELIAELHDLNNDRRADIFWNYSGNGRSSFGAFRGTEFGWIADSRFAPPEPLDSNPAGRPYDFSIVWLKGGGHPQFVYHKSQRDPGKQLPKIYSHDGQAWTVDKDLTVPLDIARFDRADLGVRFPDLNGDGFADIAFTTEKKNNPPDEIAWVFHPGDQNPWQEDSRYQIPVATFSEDLKDTGTFLVDFNGDGITDVLHAYQPANQNAQPIRSAYVNCSFLLTLCPDTTKSRWLPVSGNTPGLVGYIPPVPFAQEGLGSLGVRPIDINGDGLTDLVVARDEYADPTKDPVRAVYLNTGKGWSTASYKNLHLPVSFLRPGDDPSQGLPPIDNRVELIDLNGDRLPDILYHSMVRVFETLTEGERQRRVENGESTVRQSEVKLDKKAFLNRGDRWEEAPNYAPPLRLDDDAESPYRKYFFEDVNGDGQVDLVYAERSGNQSKSRTYLNTGTGWTVNPIDKYRIPDKALVEPSIGDLGFRFLDVNADGLVDIAYHRILADGKSLKGAFLNTGTGWREADEANESERYAPPLPFYEEGRVDLGIRPLDLNGDGIVDLAQTYKRSNEDTQNTVWLNMPFSSGSSKVKTDLLIEVENGLGMKTRAEYRSLIGVDFHKDKLLEEKAYRESQRHPSYPIVDPPLPGYVVTRVESEGPGVLPRSSQYRYGEYRVNTKTGKSLGFGFQEIVDVERGRTTSIQYLQDDGLVGNVAASTSFQQTRQSNVKVASSESSFDVISHLGVPFSHGFRPSILQANIRQSLSQSWDLEGELLSTQSDKFNYDGNGNPERIHTVFGDGSGSETINKYRDDLRAWHLGRLAKSTTKLFAPKKKDQERTATFEYASTTGQLIKEASLVGTDHELVTSYNRDVFGNKILSTIKVKTGEANRSVGVEYDKLGRFPVSSVNQLGHRSRVEFDQVSGSVLARIDPNNVRVSFTFDSLNRLRQEVASTGLAVLTDTRFAEPHSQLAFTVSKKTEGLPAVTTTHDAAGRPRLESSIGFGNKPVVVGYEYDNLGRLTRSSLPHFQGEEQRYTVRNYDELDRVTEERHPDGAVIKISFKGLKTTVTDPLGRITVIEKDDRGKTTKTNDPLNGETRFEYDVSGKVVQIVNALKQTSHIQYDLAGQRIALEDPALGAWRYKYNGFSELIEQTDSRGERINLRYDQLGRLVRRESHSGRAEYLYDEVEVGEKEVERFLGQLLRTRSESSQKDIRYDQHGRVKSLNFRVGSNWSEVLLSYDDYSRPISRKYSSGFVAYNHFDELGFWREVRIGKENEKNNNHSAAWQALEIDAMGRVVKEKLGNGVINSHRFNEMNGRLESSVSTGLGDLKLLDFVLEYDLAGNVLKRSDLAQGRVERFRYDALNRLVRSEGLPTGNSSVTYDELGNIRTKTDVGEYHYCERKPTKLQLCEVRGEDGNITTLRYDAAGNVVRLGSQEVTYDSEGKVTGIKDGSFNHSEFTYGPDGELVHQVSSYYANKYEVTYLGDTELLQEEFTPPLFPTPERTRLRHSISTPTGTLGFFEYTYLHFPYRHVTPMLNNMVIRHPLRTTEVSSGMTYFLKDHLGSIRAILNKDGDITERLDYDAWGKRIQSTDNVYHSIRQGFTGHEHLDSFGLVHMEGRVYSVSLGRFISPDPFIHFLGYSQSHNRYGYVLNNPLRFIDPSGLFLGDVFRAIGDAVGAIGSALANAVDAVIGKPLRWVGEQLHKAGRWLQENWRTVAVIAAAVALGPAGYAVFGTGLLGAVATGAAVGGFSAALYGGGPSDIFRGAVIGAISGALFYGAGSAKVGDFGRSLLHGGAGGVMSSLRGSSLEQGFLSGFAGNALTPGGEVIPDGYGVAAASVVGGVTAEIGGDSFENGALTAAFGRLFNDLYHENTPRAEGLHRRVVIRDEDGKPIAGFSFGMDQERDPNASPFTTNFFESSAAPGPGKPGNGVVYQDMTDPTTKTVAVFKTTSAEDKMLANYMRSRINDTAPYNALTNSCRTFSGTEFEKMKNMVLKARQSQPSQKQ